MTSKKASGGASKGSGKKLKLKKETVRDLDVRKNVKGGLLKGNIGGTGAAGGTKVGGVSGPYTGVDCDANSCGPACTHDLRCI